MTMLALRQRIRRLADRKYYLFRLEPKFKRALSLDELQRCAPTLNQQYSFCVYFFDHFLPAAFREHRHYFVENCRGFGEDAFHSMWFLLFEKFRPQSALEIGVYRGQTVTLWKLLAQHFGFECRVACVSPFTAAGDSVGHYEQLDYLKDLELNHQYFSLPMPQICRQLSTAPEAKEFISAQAWNLIYIDGNHDYEIARQDWTVCSRAVARKGLIVLDDSALDTGYRPPAFSSAGHPGPSRLASEIDPSQFCEILAVGHNRVFQRL